MERGTRVRVVNTKWGGRAHWEYDAHYLGRDEHGDWIGVPPGTVFSRPGREFTGDNDQVVLVPHVGVGGGAAWMATFHAPNGRDWAQLGSDVDVYVDMTTVATWDGTTVTAVDLDLDVIRGTNGVVVVDDEDEFAEHQVAFGYPPEVVSLAEESCSWVLSTVRSGSAPFDRGADGTAGRWLASLNA